MLCERFPNRFLDRLIRIEKEHGEQLLSVSYWNRLKSGPLVVTSRAQANFSSKSRMIGFNEFVIQLDAFTTRQAPQNDDKSVYQFSELPRTVAADRYKSQQPSASTVTAHTLLTRL